MTTLTRFLPLSQGSFFLFGPRGTGKTTWLRSVLPDALFVDLLRPEEYRRLAARPERLRELVRGTAPGSDIVVDEIQRVPELLNVVHDLLETGNGHRFVLTGSSARKLRRGGVNLLAGRAVLRSMHPFMAGEMGPAFDLATSLRLGTVPTVVSSQDPGSALAAYAALYVEQEVRAEGLARDVGSFSRFLEAAAFSHAATLNVSELARECETSRTTVAGYLELLEDLLLSFRLPVFTRRARRRLVAHPRFFYFDCGVYRSLRPAGPLDRPTEKAGPALEGLVAQHLRAWLAYSRADARLYYWRTRGGAEVDLVIYGAAGFWGFDVMNADRIRPADLRGLTSFGDEYPEARRVLLYRGSRRIVRRDVLCVPVEDFLRALDPERGLEDASGAGG
ncbi:MAG: ATP-binding protein [Gemmatimonadetes bacterium]|nr:ATP-binding protein [Gemmatimonadota bacterium]MXX71740.1 ATP-binding protein [Gemmatimonadota bacterium]MYC92741.1 ATP-binding protein [Gemmatimonadota bacterium]MYG36640.1 ATP-binding protein [Gemmatimonadota bacterium]MYJ18882.1 ATP-binding protein [Gemmatimonadota bacterium]